MKYLGFILLILSGYVMAEEVYYCSDNDANGFNPKNGVYKPTLMVLKKFKMKLQDDGNIAIQDDGNIAIAEPRLSNGRWLYICSTPYEGRQSMEKNKSCVEEDNNGYYLNFNQHNGRYVRFSGFGYVFDNSDSDGVITRIGTCTKF